MTDKTIATPPAALAGEGPEGWALPTIPSPVSGAAWSTPDIMPLLEYAMQMLTAGVPCDCDRLKVNACGGECVGSRIWEAIGRARKLIRADLASRAPATVPFDAARVIAWIDDPNRKPANVAFTAGDERQIAYRFEMASAAAPAIADEAGVEDVLPPERSQVKRDPGNFDFYERRGEKWFCKTCKGVVAAFIRHYSVWDGPGPCSGSGEVETTQEPYCPNCEAKPT